MLFKQLESAFESLINISHLEKTVILGDLSITIRTLTAQEEVEIQKIIASYRNAESSALEFVDVFRYETLSRAIVQINDTDLRNVSTVDTGEYLDNGVAIKIPKQEAILQILHKIPRMALNKIFEAQTILTEETEKKVSSFIEIKEKDLGAEAILLEERAQNLRTQENLEKMDETTKASLNSLSQVKTPNFSEALKEINNFNK